MMFRTVFAILVCLGFTVMSSAQPEDVQEGGVRIDAGDPDTSEGERPISPFSSERPSLSNPARAGQNPFTINSNPQTDDSFDTEKKKDFNMSTDHGLKTRKFDYTPRWATRDAAFKDEYKEGQSLGILTTASEYLEVLCRDHQMIDGDRVQLIVNGKLLVGNIYLVERFQSFIVDLQYGKNVIEFLALNQGTSGPNTAHFRAFDDKENKLSDTEWNLATGAKATLVVYRLDSTDDKKLE